jgi:hypothetical protein
MKGPGEKKEIKDFLEKPEGPWISFPDMGEGRLYLPVRAGEDTSAICKLINKYVDWMTEKEKERTEAAERGIKKYRIEVEEMQRLLREAEGCLKWARQKIIEKLAGIREEKST